MRHHLVDLANEELPLCELSVPVLQAMVSHKFGTRFNLPKTRKALIALLEADLVPSSVDHRKVGVTGAPRKVAATKQRDATPKPKRTETGKGPPPKRKKADASASADTSTEMVVWKDTKEAKVPVSKKSVKKTAVKRLKNAVQKVGKVASTHKTAGPARKPKNISAYNVFVQEMGQSNLRGVGFYTLCGARWKTTSEHAREKYQKEADALNRRHAKAGSAAGASPPKAAVKPAAAKPKSSANKTSVGGKVMRKPKIPTKQEIADKIATNARPTKQELHNWIQLCDRDPKLDLANVRKFWCKDVSFMTPALARSLIGKHVYVLMGDFRIVDVEEFTKKNKISRIHRLKIIEEVSSKSAAFVVEMAGKDGKSFKLRDEYGDDILRTNPGNPVFMFSAK